MQGVQTMIKKMFLLVFLSIFMFSSHANAEKTRGIVVFSNDDIVVVEYTYGYYCGVELYSGFVYEGDIIIGDFGVFAFQEMYNFSMNSPISVYVDENMMSEDEAKDWIVEKIR